MGQVEKTGEENKFLICIVCLEKAYYKRTIRTPHFEYIYRCEKCKLDLASACISLPAKATEEFYLALGLSIRELIKEHC